MNLETIDPAVKNAAVEYIVSAGLGQHFLMTRGMELALTKHEVDVFAFREFDEHRVPLHADLLDYICEECAR